MTLEEVGEFGLLEALALFGAPAPSGWVGPGDDAAVVSAGGVPVLFTTDLLIEGVHFRLSTTPARDLGFKALAANVSDIAAMGGKALAYTIALAAPGETAVPWLQELYAGFGDASREFGCRLVGGDTSSGPRLFLSIGLLGLAPPTGAVLRSGARPGDGLYVTGTLGDSATGLRLLESGTPLNTPARKTLADRHRRPAPRVALGSALGERGLAAAMIDVSDGLLQDLGHILRQSGIGADVGAEEIPLSPSLRAVCAEAGLDPLEAALSGGEDYELLFAVRPEHEAAVREAASRAGTALARIGRATAEGGLRVLRSGEPLSLSSIRGFDHFRR